MNKYWFLLLSVFVLTIYGCNRSPSKPNSDNAPISVGNNNDPQNITYDDPFKNQPTEFCTVIRKLEVNYYDPEKNAEDLSEYPKKYCLLDVCIDNIDNSGLVINLGDSLQIANAVFSLIKVFESYEEAKAYELKYGIIDAFYEE